MNYFPNKGNTKILKHNALPLYISEEFDFFRCIPFKNEFYGKTVSELHAGNLRDSGVSNRYSKLFEYEKVSYWSDSPQTARAEYKAHSNKKDYLMFWSYDDLTSTFPTLGNDEPLIIVDGRDFGFSDILEKSEKGVSFSKQDKTIIQRIAKYNPDCLAYDSKRRKNGINFMFFEKGFKKLAIRKLKLFLNSRYRREIICADSCDYSPCIAAYGECFLPIAKTKMDERYLKTNEYRFRRTIFEESLKLMHDEFK